MNLVHHMDDLLKGKAIRRRVWSPGTFIFMDGDQLNFHDSFGHTRPFRVMRSAIVATDYVVEDVCRCKDCKRMFYTDESTTDGLCQDCREEIANQDRMVAKQYQRAA